MKYFWLLAFLPLSFLSCNQQKGFETGTFFLYDTLDDSAFFATETLKENGEGIFKEWNIYEGDTCQIAQITFNWKVIKNRLIYENQQHATVEDCKDVQGYAQVPNQVYEILEKGKDFFIAKTYFENDLAPTDSTIVLWKRQSK